MNFRNTAILILIAAAAALVLTSCDALTTPQNVPKQRSPIVKEPWMSKPPQTWPQIVLTNEAEFRGSTPLQGASSFLIRTSDHRILAATAKHLLGSAGGVEPEVPYSQLDSWLHSWKMFPRTIPRDFIEIESLRWGPAKPSPGGDWPILNLKKPLSKLPAQPLCIRSEPVRVGEKVFLIGVPYTEPNCKQNVYVGRVTVRLHGDRFRYDLDRPVALPGFSGAPIVDENGYLVGVITVSFDAKMSGDLYLEGGGEDATTIYEEVEGSP